MEQVVLLHIFIASDFLLHNFHKQFVVLPPASPTDRACGDQLLLTLFFKGKNNMSREE